MFTPPTHPGFSTVCGSKYAGFRWTKWGIGISGFASQAYK